MKKLGNFIQNLTNKIHQNLGTEVFDNVFYLLKLILKNKVKEKEFMKKRLVHTMSEDIPLIPDDYISYDFP